MALQLRRGTNAERLAMTPVNGELIFVTDYELVTTSVTSINTTTETLTTTAAHGLSVNQQVKYIGATLNGLTKDQVYFVKTAPTITTFTLSTTSGGSTLNIQGHLQLIWYLPKHQPLPQVFLWVKVWQYCGLEMEPL